MKLRFKIQPYQTAAVESVVDCFAGQPNLSGMSYRIDPGKELKIDTKLGLKNAELVLSRKELLENIQKVQLRQNLPVSKKLKDSAGRDIEENSESWCPINLDVEMETGTGKTYCYIKTMFELNRRYGWTKFIVMVPSIAIREGVSKSLAVTAGHFQETYGKKAHFFTYNSKFPHNLESFSSSADLNVMVINIQAFNAVGKDNLRIYEELDDFGTRRPIDVISANRPILILDEPQKMEGKKTLDALKKFNPLYDTPLFRHASCGTQQGSQAGCSGCLQPEAGEENRCTRHIRQRAFRHECLFVSGRHRSFIQGSGCPHGDGNKAERRLHKKNHQKDRQG